MSHSGRPLLKCHILQSQLSIQDLVGLIYAAILLFGALTLAIDEVRAILLSALLAEI